jgi:hypothetical protein
MIPEAQIVDSLRSVATSLDKLTHLVDFIARIQNEDSPRLLSFESIDSRGDWGVLRHQFGVSHRGVDWFPLVLPPIIVRSLPLAFDKQIVLRDSERFANDFSRTKTVLAELNMDDLPADLRRTIGHAIGRLPLSPLHPVNMDSASRAGSLIPDDAYSFAWCYPSIKPNAVFGVRRTDPWASFLLIGGFVYFTAAGKVCAVNAAESVGYSHRAEEASANSELGILQFGNSAQLCAEAAAELIEGGRFFPITFPALWSKGARYFAWIRPGERLRCSEPVPALGAFAYLFRNLEDPPDPRDRYFPIIPQ